MTENLPPTGHDQLELVAMLGLGAMAAHFVTEPETWPVFMAYLDTQSTGPVQRFAMSKHSRRRCRQHAHSLFRLARAGSEASR